MALELVKLALFLMESYYESLRSGRTHDDRASIEPSMKGPANAE